MRCGSTLPNPASWVIWCIVASVNACSYLAGTNDWVKALNAFVSASNCLFMFGYCWRLGSLRALTRNDTVAISIAILAVIFWKWSSNAWYGNVLVQLAVIMSFTLTIVGVITEKRREWWIPWALWTGCHLITLGIVLLRWTGDLYALVYPALGIACNATLTAVALWKQPAAVLTSRPA